MTKGAKTYETKIEVGLDRRAPFTVADRREQFDAAMKVHAMFGTMSDLVARIQAEGLPLDAYGWYLDLRKYGTFVHAGFGLGVERTVAWICGIPHIREAIAFPRTLYKLWP